MTFSNHASEYAHRLQLAEANSRPWLYLVAAGWALCPFLVRTVALNPEDMIWLQYKVQGLHLPPHGFTAQQVGVGFTEAVIALAVLILVQLVCTVMFYRRSQLDMPGLPVATPVLWPLAALAPGAVGNLIWYWWTGYFDLHGCLIGLSPAWLTFGAELIINRLGKNFIYGKQTQPFGLLGPASAPAQGPVSYYIPE
jgi:hypothetical protein